MNRMRVLKFGGSSVGTPDTIRQVTGIVKKKSINHKLAIVVSAFSGVTNSLIEAAECASKGSDSYKEIIRDIESRHIASIKELLPIQIQSGAITESGTMSLMMFYRGFTWWRS
jgi:aspartokinase/homoserine dehydrogenase 1